MSTNYPNSVDSYAVHQDGGVEDITASDVNNLQDAIVSIEQTLGSGATKPTSSATASAIVTRDANGTASLNALSIPGLAGATTPTRIVGGTNGSAPTTGTWNKGDEVTDVTGTKWICTAAGTPGTWTKIKAGSADTATNASELNGQPASYYANSSQANSSASGTWSPTSGSLNVSAGTYITLSAVPGTPKLIFAQDSNGAPTGTTINMPCKYTLIGSIQGQKGYEFYQQDVNGTFTNQQGTGYYIYVFDGTYAVQGYFVVSGGNLQFYVQSNIGAIANYASQVSWAVA